MSSATANAVETVTNVAGVITEKSTAQASKWVQVVAMIGFPAAMIIWWMQAVQIPNETQQRDHKERLMAAHEMLVKEHGKLVNEFGGLKDILRDIRDDQRKFPAVKQDVSPGK
jgi:hypothetical protein